MTFQSPIVSERLRVEGVNKRFPAPNGRGPGTLVLAETSLALKEGEFVCLLGPSGCGKSTLLNIIAGFERPDGGRVLDSGAPIVAPGPERGMVFQQPALFPWLNLLDNVTFGPRMAGMPASRYREEARRYIKLVGLAGFETHMPWQLSGGMRQRAAMARAWLPKPHLLLMDEPFGALDAQTRLMMQELLTEIWLSERTTILFVTHDVDEALLLADRIIVMSARPGRICEDVAVTLDHPREADELAATPEFGALKRHILRTVRSEAKKALA